jgi:fucose permease
MNINKPVITIASFIALGCNGLIITFMGVSLPSLQRHLDIGLEQAGTLMALFQAGFTILTLLGGIFADRMHREWIICGGSFALGTGALLLCYGSSYYLSLLAAVSMGTGIGLILSGSNTLLVSLYPSHKGAILNIHHVFFGIGAIVGPSLMGLLILRGNHWQAGYIGAAFLLFLLALIYAISENKAPVPFDSQSRDLGSFFQLFNLGKFNIISLVNFLSMGSQIAVMLFGTVFLIEAKQSSLAEASGALTIFSGGIVFGRMVCSKLTLIKDSTTIVLALLWLQSLTMLLAWQGNGLLALAALAVSGFTFSGTYPTLLALTSSLFPKRDGLSLGLLSTMGGLGSIVLCWLTGFVAGLSDMKTGFSITVIACFLGLVVFQLNYSALSKWEKLHQKA